MIRFFKKFEYYNSNDELPVFNWFKIQETEDLTWLLINKRKISKTETEVLKTVLRKLVDDYIDKFGISTQYQRILELQRDIRVKEIEIITTGDKSNKAFIEVYKRELKQLIESNNKADVSDLKANVTKYMKIQLDFKKMPVNEFYSIIKQIKAEQNKTES